MKSEELGALRKHLIGDMPLPEAERFPSANELDLRSCATVHFSSEHSEHPIDHLFDHHSGLGATKWVAGRRDRAETILFVFDGPRDISHCAFEAEECKFVRTQEVRAEFLAEDDGVYHQSFIQEFNFSPDGANYQREFIPVDLRAVRRFRLTVRADKSGRGVASLTVLRLFGDRSSSACEK